jgi:hypothetical protein
LSCYNVETKLVRGEGIDGKPFNGIVYSAMDDTGKTIGNPFKSSLFGKSFGYEGLNKKMKRNEKDLKDGKYAPMIRGAIAAAMKATRNREEFISLLKSSGIDAVFRTNDTGRLYGATFIDHHRKEVYNGSALGKEFSANVFHRMFNESPAEQADTRTDTTRSQSNNYSASAPDNRATALEQIFGLVDFQPTHSGNDYEEENFLRKTKRRKKKKKLTVSG